MQSEAPPWRVLPNLLRGQEEGRLLAQTWMLKGAWCGRGPQARPRDARFQCPHVPPPARSFPEGLLRAHCLSSASHACLSHYKRPCDQRQRARALVTLHALTSRVTLTDCVNSSESIPIRRGPACTPSPGGLHEAQTAGSSEIRKTESGKQYKLSGCQPLRRAPEKLPGSVSCGCKSGGTRPSTVPVPLARAHG